MTRVLKEKLRYTWRANCQRAPNAFNPKHVAQRELFPNLISLLEQRGFLIIYVDECTIDPSAISNRSWQKKGDLQPLIRSTDSRINLIAAWIFKRKYAFMMKKGSTSSYHIKQFFDLLNEKMTTTFSSDYIEHTVFVLDNAKVHVSAESRKYFYENKFRVLTLPPYTPEQNKVERVFLYLKMKLKKECLFNKRLEYLVANAITEL